MSPVRSRSLHRRISAGTAPVVPALERPRARPRMGRGEWNIDIGQENSQAPDQKYFWRSARSKCIRCVPCAAQHGASRSDAQWCTADPGPPQVRTPLRSRVLQRITTLRSVLRCARETANGDYPHQPLPPTTRCDSRVAAEVADQHLVEETSRGSCRFRAAATGFRAGRELRDCERQQNGRCCRVEWAKGAGTMIHFFACAGTPCPPMPAPGRAGRPVHRHVSPPAAATLPRNRPCRLTSGLRNPVREALRHSRAARSSHCPCSDFRRAAACIHEPA